MKITLNNMLDTLLQKYIIGIGSGVGSWLLSITLSLFTIDTMMSVFGKIGVICGAMIAVITLILKIYELIEKIKK